MEIIGRFEATDAIVSLYCAELLPTATMTKIFLCGIFLPIFVWSLIVKFLLCHFCFHFISIKFSSESQNQLFHFHKCKLLSLFLSFHSVRFCLDYHWGEFQWTFPSVSFHLPAVPFISISPPDVHHSPWALDIVRAVCTELKRIEDRLEMEINYTKSIRTSVRAREQKLNDMSQKENKNS